MPASCPFSRVNARLATMSKLLSILSYFLALYFLALDVVVLAQLSLPSPQFIPPTASESSQPSNTTSIPNPQWSNLLGNLIYFYDIQRSGKLPSSNRVSWRNDSALDDGQDVGLDLSGGYYDAGDYIKATFPLSFALMSVCWGAIEYGKGYDLTNQTAYLDSILRWGLDWIIKAHPSNNTLYVLIGDVNIDNAYWGGDQNIPSPRPSFQINDTSPGTDAAAGASAAFSACSALYSGQTFNSSFSTPASLQNNTYAALLQTHAEALYTFATSASGGKKLYQDSVPAVASAYASSGYGDELTIAALLLSFTTNSSDLFDQAEGFYGEYKLSGQDDTYNWDYKTPALAVLFAKLSAARPELGGSLSQWQTEAEGYFDNIIDGESSGIFTDGGLIFYDDTASLNPAMNLALLLNLYSPLASSPDKSWKYTDFADKQLNYALGKNPMSCPYIVGVSENSPQNPHSGLTSGDKDITNPGPEEYVLYGAVVGGPDNQDRYFDIRSDWPETEPALDINSPLLTLAALHAMNDTLDPFYTALEPGAYNAVKPSGTPCDEAFPCSHTHSLNRGGKIAVAVVVTIVGLIILGGLLFWFRLYRKNRRCQATKGVGEKTTVLGE